jgi:hypothetical protein
MNAVLNRNASSLKGCTMYVCVHRQWAENNGHLFSSITGTTVRPGLPTSFLQSLAQLSDPACPTLPARRAAFTSAPL